MFRHGDEEKPKSEETKPETKSEAVPVVPIEPPKHQPDIRELLEKNLKWSQIIYEQNRKINNKLLWSAVAEWIRLAIIIIPIIFALWFLPPYIRSLQDAYGKLLNPTGTGNQTSSIEDLLKVLPLTPQQQEQIKSMIGR